MSESKSPLLLRYLALQRRQRKLTDDWGAFHAAAIMQHETCLHEVTREDKRHNDNGYGHWWTTFSKVCVFCEKALESRTEDGCL